MVALDRVVVEVNVHEEVEVNDCDDDVVVKELGGGILMDSQIESFSESDELLEELLDSSDSLLLTETNGVFNILLTTVVSVTKFDEVLTEV